MCFLEFTVSYLICKNWNIPRLICCLSFYAASSGFFSFASGSFFCVAQLVETRCFYLPTKKLYFFYSKGLLERFIGGYSRTWLRKVNKDCVCMKRSIDTSCSKIITKILRNMWILFNNSLSYKFLPILILRFSFLLHK